MQFDTAWIYGGASLSDTCWVLGAALWGAFLAKLGLLAIRAAGLKRLGFVASVIGALLAARVGTHFLANLMQFPHTAVSYSWGPHWIAIPIGAVILGFRLLQPSIDRWLSLARAVAFLNCIHAVWAMVGFPSELFAMVEPETRPGFETIVLAVPATAICGVLALLVVQMTWGRAGRVAGWREWLSARLQLLLALLTLLVQQHWLGLAAFPFMERTFPLTTFLTASGLLLGAMAAARIRSRSTSTPLEHSRN